MPIVTTFYAGILGLLALALAALVVSHRRRAKVGLGGAGDSGLERAIRVHGNFTEYAPLVVILMGLNELCGAPAWLLHGCGAPFVVARVWHAAGLSRKSGLSQGRFVGTLMTWVVLLSLSLAALWFGGARVFGA